ncbi:hypothetical protein [Streptococcus sp. A12]|jgi:hypothetical protein|uniref:hypothetical protein n=1 Tax=Streptococcus sp. A12 TaxID=1759399 RepID=UPI0025E00100|nr:hypothetical protein [Streptococcus sp. A12]
MKDFERHQLATELGFQYDPETSSIYGENSGYFFLLRETDTKNVFTIAISVSRDDAEEAATQLHQMVKDSSVLKSISLNQYVTTFTVKAGMTKAKTNENVRQALTEILQFLQTNGFYTVCGYSGEKGLVGLYQIGDSLFLMNEDSFQELSTQLKIETDSYNSQKENVLLGTVGAFIGAIIGGAVTLFIARLGYVAFYAGFILGICVVKGYEILGKKFSKLGAVISSILLLVTIVLVHQFDYALEAVKQLGVDFSDGFDLINTLVLNGEAPEKYFFNFFMLAVFTIIGGGVAISSALSTHKTRGIARKIG